MKRSEKTTLPAGVGFLTAFLLWTVLIQLVDVQAAGPNGTRVGFAAFNLWFHRLTGVHMTLYTITDWLGLVPILVCLCFGALGFVHRIARFLRIGNGLLDVFGLRVCSARFLCGIEAFFRLALLILRLIELGLPFRDLGFRGLIVRFRLDDRILLLFDGSLRVVDCGLEFR